MLVVYLRGIKTDDSRLRTNRESPKHQYMSFPTLISSRLNLYRQQTVNVIKQQKQQRSPYKARLFRSGTSKRSVCSSSLNRNFVFYGSPCLWPFPGVSRLQKNCEKVDFSHAVQLAIINVTKRVSAVDLLKAKRETSLFKFGPVFPG